MRDFVRGGGRSRNQTRLSIQIAVNRQKNREFFRFRIYFAIREIISLTVGGAFERIPYSAEQRIFPAGLGFVQKG
jgi:hypothetical protein